MFLTEMPRTQLLRYCCCRLGFGPSEATSLSERFPLRPQGSLIFREKEPPSPEPAFKKKKNHLLSIPHFSKSIFLSLPSSCPSHGLLFPLRFSLGLYPERQASLNHPAVCLSFLFPPFLIPPFLGKAGSIHLPSVIANTAVRSKMYVYDCRCVYVDVCVCFLIHICLHNTHSVFLAKIKSKAFGYPAQCTGIKRICRHMQL